MTSSGLLNSAAEAAAETRDFVDSVTALAAPVSLRWVSVWASALELGLHVAECYFHRFFFELGSLGGLLLRLRSELPVSLLWLPLSRSMRLSS